MASGSSLRDPSNGAAPHFRGRRAALAELEVLQQKSASAAAAAVAADVAFLRAVTDFADIIRLARTDVGFRPAAQDKARGIQMYTMPVSISPIHMMKARTVMPCTPREFLRWLELENRPLWDDHFIAGKILPEGHSFQTAMYSELGRGPSAAHIDVPRPPTSAPKPSLPGAPNTARRSGTGSVGAQGILTSMKTEPSHDADETLSNSGSLLAANENRPAVWLKYMAFKAPVPIVQRRDFEFFVAEQMLPDGTAVLKAISPELGRCTPPVPGYIRGFIEVSGFVAEPLTAKSCRVTYVALVNPMGLVPPAVINVLVGKQTSALAQLQSVIAANPAGPIASDGAPSKSNTLGGGGGAGAPSVAEQAGPVAGVSSWISRLRANL